MVLVDTSIWIEYLDRANPAIETEMDELIRTAGVATVGLVLAELRQGCRSRRQLAVLLEALEPLTYHEADWHTWLGAGAIAAEGVVRGQRFELGDCLLAAIALREDCPIFTLDRDFERMPRVRLHRNRKS